jgi:predicted acylesterase/phospholipase RssA
MVHNLALSGGGAHVMAFIGCIRVMEERGLLQNIKEFVGASAGSLLALMLTVGFDAEEIREFVRANLTNENSLKISLKDAWKITKTFGFDDGQSIVELIHLIFDQKKIDRTITFIELAKLTGKNLVITVANVNRESVEFMCVDNTPDLDVRTAIRASTSVPILYQPVLYKEEYYVDSLFFNNFPIDFFKRWSTEKHTIGLNIVMRKTSVNSIWDFFRNLFHGTVHARTAGDHEMVCEVDCSELPNFDVRNMRFDLSLSNFERLLALGEEAAEEFCRRRELSSQTS